MLRKRIPDYFLPIHKHDVPDPGTEPVRRNPANVQSFIAATDDDPSGTDPTADVSGGLIVNYTNAICSTPLMAADGEAPATVMAAALKTGDVGPALLAARTLWRKAGLSGDEHRKLESIAIELTDLPGAMLGEARGSLIALDRTAAGWGWFVDPTPIDDDEFGKTIAQDVADRIDLLTVLAHEIGHVPRPAGCRGQGGERRRHDRHAGARRPAGADRDPRHEAAADRDTADAGLHAAGGTHRDGDPWMRGSTCRSRPRSGASARRRRSPATPSAPSSATIRPPARRTIRR